MTSIGIEEDVASLVHDLRAPLLVISLETSLLEVHLGSPLPAAARRAIARMERNISFLGRMVDDLLAASAGVLAYDDVELGAIAERVVSRLPDSDAARVATFLSPTLVRVDALRIERVIENLVHNALRYSPAPSGIDLRLAAAQATATMSIVDAGPGLSIDEIAAVFDRHRRGEAGRGHAGFGIGLYASRKMIEAHGGRLCVESVVGSGARFYFELPIATPP